MSRPESPASRSRTLISTWKATAGTVLLAEGYRGGCDLRTIVIGAPIFGRTRAVAAVGEETR
jgi:hypothetical protein